TMKPCPHCGGTGHVRSDSSVALHVVRAIEEFLLKDSRSHITVKTAVATALYVLNHKRSKLTELEARFGVTITVEADDTVGAQHYQIFRGAIAEKPADFVPVVTQPAPVEEPDEPEIEIADEDEAEDQQPQRQQRHDGEDGEHHRDRKRRRRRRRGGRDREHHNGSEQPHVSAETADGVHSEAANDDEGGEDAAEQAATPQANGEDRKKRRRGKRGGKRNRSRDGDDAEAHASSEGGGENEADDESEASSGTDTDEAYSANGEGRDNAAQPILAEVETVSEEIRAVEPVEEPARASRRRVSSDAPTEPVVSSSSAAPEADKPKKGGWWQRKGFF
ncbi:MAG TPA: ribonuclease E/G, partial [Rhizobiaceae bacterium]|nr:ribonuclease E/G [Rhizobiaceae bacterium]